MNTRHDFTRGLTRIAFGLALVLLPIGAQALDLTPDASRVVSDPAYLPLGGQLFGSTEYSNGNTSSNTDNYLAAPKSSNNTLSNTVNQAFEYGITNIFSGELRYVFN
jgi:hypothetical protein